MPEDECIFCKIVRGEIPCAELYSDDKILAFLDIAPVNHGHALVIPREHYPTLFDIPDSLARELLAAMRRVGYAVMCATRAEGLNVGMNNHKAAGQLVPHAHFHLIPRFANDGLSLWDQKAYESQDEAGRVAEAVREMMSRGEDAP